jgi:hypothetical protein
MIARPSAHREKGSYPFFSKPAGEKGVRPLFARPVAGAR